MPIRLAIADDHPIVIKGLLNVLNDANDIEIHDTYASGHQLLDGLKNRQPDVLILDIQMPDKTGNECARIIHKKWPDIKMLVFSNMDSTFHVKDMLQNGCLGYITKNTNQITLLNAIRRVYEGEQFLEPGLKELLLKNLTRVSKIEITRREKEILKLIAEEYTSQNISDKLYISLKTVESHRFSLFQKLNVKNSIGLVKVAMQMGILD